MTSAVQENARMLASILGIGEEEAAARLKRTVLITVEEAPQYRAWAADIAELLGLTVDLVDGARGKIDAELVIGKTVPRSGAPVLYASMGRELATVALQEKSGQDGIPHPFLAACAAPMVVAAVLNTVVADDALPRVSLPLTFRFDQLGLADGALRRQRDLTGMVMAGAGAVGHGFLRALRHLPTAGVLPIVDPKNVAEGNFNRCTYLYEEDLGKDKAVVLAERAQPDFGKLALEPFVGDFAAYCKDAGPQQVVIVTVDSRRARRSIQTELPGAVIDASTTDVRAVVIHSHKQPTQDACLSCIYRHVPEEHAREQSIADGIGVGLGDVRSGLITSTAANLIHTRYPDVDPAVIVGKAYDSLFKELCAAQALKSDEGRQVLAPFSFVSALAGCYLVVELLRSMDGIAATNYWTADPWGLPSRRRRVTRPRHVNCEFCSRAEVQTVAKQLWGRT